MKETPDLINRILAMLQTLGTTENKKVLLRVISTLSQNDENKLEIGKYEEDTLHSAKIMSGKVHFIN